MINPLLITAGADKMALTDPHGLTLSVVSVCVVFSCLLILYIIYSLSGELFIHKLDPKRKKSGKGIDEGTAAAIAMALEAEEGHETEAAIATALHLYLSGDVHDQETYKITISRKDSPWADKSANFRKKV